MSPPKRRTTRGSAPSDCDLVAGDGTEGADDSRALFSLLHGVAQGPRA